MAPLFLSSQGMLSVHGNSSGNKGIPATAGGGADIPYAWAAHPGLGTGTEQSHSECYCLFLASRALFYYPIRSILATLYVFTGPIDTASAYVALFNAGDKVRVRCTIRCIFADNLSSASSRVLLCTPPPPPPPTHPPTHRRPFIAPAPALRRPAVCPRRWLTLG